MPLWKSVSPLQSLGCPGHYFVLFYFVLLSDFQILSSLGNFSFLLSFLSDRVSLHSLGCPGTPFKDQAGLKLTETLLPLPPRC